MKLLALLAIVAPIVSAADCWPPYNPNLSYAQGSKVSANGNNWQAAWWAGPNNPPGVPNWPTDNQGWKASGTCSGANYGAVVPVAPSAAAATPVVYNPVPAPVTTYAAGSCFAQWDASKEYPAGSQVWYKGVNWKAKWYTNHGNPPGEDPWPTDNKGWTAVGACGASVPYAPPYKPGSSPSYQPSANYVRPPPIQDHHLHKPKPHHHHKEHHEEYASDFQGYMPPKPSYDPAPAYVAPKAPTYAAPAAPAYVAPKAPTYVAPAAPAYVAPKAPTYVAPAAPAYVAPKAPTYAAPAAPAYVAPKAPTYAAPAAPTYVAPKAPTYVAPAAPAYVAPKAPTYVAPAVPAYVAPAVPAYVAPKAPTYAAPAAPAAPTYVAPKAPAYGAPYVAPKAPAYGAPYAPPARR